MGSKKQSRLVRNVSWIFIGNVVHSLLNFLLGIFVARKLSLNDNGILEYAASWITFFTALSSLGFSSTITREFSKYKDRMGDFLCGSMVTRAVAAVFAMLLLQVIVRILNPGEPFLYLIVFCQSTTILFNALDIFVYWYRYQDKASLAAAFRLIAFLVSALWRVAALLSGAGLVPYAIGTAAEILIYGLLMAFFFKRMYVGPFSYSLKTVRLMLKSSYPFIFSAVLSTVYSQADRIMIKSMVDNAAVALYSVAAHLAAAVSAIPTALIEGFRPDIMEYKDSNPYLYEKRLRQLYCIVFWSSVLYCLVITAFPTQILRLIYGEKYVAAAPVLALIVWFSTFSYFGSINNMYMVSEGKNKWVQVTTLSGALGNILLNYLLIPLWGILGAAVASLATQFIANFLLLAIIKDLRPACKHMIKGICFRDTGLQELLRKK